MLIETDTGGEREIGANPYEHSSPMGVLDIEVILIDPTPLHLEMPTIVFPDGGHVGGGLTCFDNGYNLIGLGTLEVALHKVIAPAWGIFLNGYTPFLRAVLDPMVILGGRSEEHTSELQSHLNLVCRLLLEKKNHTRYITSRETG